ncbi:MAG: leucine-rich repeat protein [Candidatus Poribacteria bacterium]|nr:leucine-rich repeat protein [Candidatus Poribacteria bacterium]
MKRAFCFFILVFTVCFVCEKRPALAVDIPPCLTIHPDLILPEPAPLENDEGEVAHRVARGVVIKSAIWEHSETVANETDSTLILRVRFLNGTDDEKALVRQIAPEWSKYADVRFEFVESDPSDIRVGFDLGDGNWSSLGKFAIGKNKTMNLALRGMLESRKQGVILHEFGHALGLHHEHKSPTLPFEWNEDVIIEEVMRVWKWTKDRIRLNILDKLSETQTNFTEFDPHSIMIYPIPNRWTIGDFEIDYATVLSETDKQFIGEIYGVARPLNGRSPQVRDAIVAAVPGVNNADDVTVAHLAEITTLSVNNIGNDSALKSDDFDGLTNLGSLELNHVYGRWGAWQFPAGIFEGLTSLYSLKTDSNYYFPIGLQKVGTNQFKVIARAGAPFDIELPLIVVNGTINGGATTITIPQGSTESALLTVTRTPGTKSKVLVILDKYPPNLPDGHSGYRFVNISYPAERSSDQEWSAGEVVTIFDALEGAPPAVKKRTRQIKEAIVKSVPRINTDDIGKEMRLYLGETGFYSTLTKNIDFYSLQVSDTDLAAITSLDLSNAELTELKPEDFEGLTNLTKLNLSFNKLRSLPRGVFDKLTNLTVLELGANELSSLIPTVLGIPDIPIFRKPSDIFDELTNLKTLELAGNELSSLPSGVFDELTNLTRLDLGGNNLSSLSSGVFDELINLTSLSIGGNELSSLQSDIFDELTNLTGLELDYNELSSLQSDIFDELTTLTSLNLEGNKFGSLPAGIFDNTTNLIGLQLSENQLSTLPVGIFDNTTNLIILALGGNQLNALPASIFSQLTNLIALDLTDNQLSTLPASIFEGLSDIDTQAVLAALNTGLDNPLDSLPQELSSLTILLSDNPVDPLPLTVSLEKIRIDGFKAVAPTGAPFDIVLPITVTNGSISGGATSLTIPKGSLQSEALTVTRAAGTTATITVDIGTPLPGLPDRHSGYAFVKSGTLPLTFVQLDRGVFTPVSDRTPEVRDAIVKAVLGIDSATDVTAAHLAAITSISVELSNSIKVGDFDGLTGLTSLGLTTEELTSLPAGLFKDLSNVTYMEWYSEKLSTLPVEAFEGLTNLQTFGWGARGLTSLPTGVLAPLTNLTTFEITAPQLNKLPANVFDRLTNLTYLSLYAGRLRILPDSIFDQLTQLKTLTLASDQLTSLPDGIFDRLAQLTSLRISRTQLTNLPDGLFSGLSSLTSLRLDGNAVDPLPLTVSLEKVGAGQFKAVASTGAPFDLILPINVTNGSINGGATTLTIPTGSVESGILTVSHTPNAIEAVAVDIGTLPALPTTVRNGTRLHRGYILTKSIDLPLEFGELGGRVFTPISERTPQVRDKIVEAVPGVNSAADVTKAHLASITGLGLGRVTLFGNTTGEEITTLQTGDFDGLTGMTTLWIAGSEQLSNVPAGIFDGLSALETLNLTGNFSSLPDGVFDGLTSLTFLSVTSLPLEGLPAGVFDDLTALTTLIVGSVQLESLSAGVFDELTALTKLAVTGSFDSLPADIFSKLTSLTLLALGVDETVTLPAGIFEGLTALTDLSIARADFSQVDLKNPDSLDNIEVDEPLPLTLSLEKVGTDQFKAVTLTGAPFNIVLPLIVTNGSINGVTSTTIRIPTGSVESNTLTVKRTPGTTAPVTLNIGTLPKLPADHEGYTLAKSAGLPLEFTNGLTTEFIPVSQRTPQVRDAIVAAVPGVNSANNVTEAHLAAITSLDLQFRLPRKRISSLKVGDFRGLTALKSLDLKHNSLRSLPHGIFDELTTLTSLHLSHNYLANYLSSQPGVFDKLTALTTLSLAQTVTSLPDGIFDELTNLTTLDLSRNSLTSLPDGIFDELTALKSLHLYSNQLASLPDDVFNNLTALTTLYLNNNDLTSLPDGIFDELTALQSLYLDLNDLSALPDGVFEGLTMLKKLYLGDNFVNPLPLTISLEKTADGQFKAVAPAGAPFDIVLPLTVTNGSINGGVSSVTISTGSVESGTLTVTRTAGTTAAVTVNVGTLPGIPTSHRGYVLRKSTTALPLAVIAAPQNRPPVFTDGTAATRTVAENTAANTNIGTAVAATDADTGDTLTYTLGGTDAASFSIVSTSGQLQTKAALDYETKASYSVTVTVSDSNGGSDSITVTINVIDLNDTIIVPTAVPVANRTSQVRDAIIAAIPGVSTANQVTAAHLAAITSLNLRNAGITALRTDDFSGMTALTDLNLFNNQLSSLPDGIFEGMTSLTTLRLGRNAVDPLPIIVSVETVVEGQFRVVVPTGATFNYVLPIRVTNGSINGGVTTVTIPQGSLESEVLTVTRTLGTTGHVMVDIAAFPRLPRTHYGYALVKSDNLPMPVIRGINTAPVFSDGTTATRSIAENTAANTNIGTPITATDVDNDRLTYTLGGTDATAFGIDSTTGQLRTKAALDYETKAAYSVTVTVSDGYGGSDSIPVTINVTDVIENRAPVFTEGSSISRTIAENTAANINIGTAITATDADNDSLTYTLSGTNASAFAIDRNTGQLRTKAALDYETKRSYSVTVTVSDGRLTDTITVTINITDVAENRAPVFADGTSTTRTIAENTAANTNIGTVIAATDADNDTLTYTLGGTDAAAFSIISTSGQLQTKAALDYETKNSYSVTITVSDGSLTDTISVTVNITDVDEGPADTPGGDTPPPTTDTRIAFEANTPAGYTRVTLNITGSVWGIPTKYTTDSDVGTVAYMTLAKLMDCNFADAEVARQSIVYIKRQSLGELNNFASEAVCRTTSRTWPSPWNGVRITHLRFFHETSLPNIKEAVYNAATDQIELPGAWPPPPNNTTNTAPVFTDGTTTTRTIAENTAANTNIGTAIAATDADNDSLTYTLSGTDAAAFSIISISGQLQTKATLDYETKNAYSVTITVSDGSLTDTITVTINITDINEVPTATAICKVGDVLAPGESCTYPGTEAVFSVLDDGNSQWNIPNLPTWLQWVNQTSISNSMRVSTTVNGQPYHFVAEELADNSWQIKEIADDTSQRPDPDPPEQPKDTGTPPTLSVSTAAPLTEATLHGGVITLNLSSGTFESSSFRIRNAVSVSGINGLTIDIFSVDRVSDTKSTVELEYDGNMTANGTLTVSVGANAIQDYNGAALTSQIAIPAVIESITASTAVPLTAATLDESVITLTLTGRKFEGRNSTIRSAVSVSGISGVTVRSSDIDRQSNTEVTVELTFNGNLNAGGTLTLTVGADAIAGYNGPPLTTQVAVSASGDTPVVETPIKTIPPVESDYDHIEGPWLWMIAPGGDIDIDNLSEASEGVITEAQIAQTGVNEGDHFNDLQWTSGRLLPTTVCGILLCSSDNVINVVREIGLTDRDQLSYYSAYALINIFSPRVQNNVLMGVGSDDSIKVWLNGSVVYENDVSRRTTGIQNQFPVNLNAGNNLLLIKVCNHAGLGFNNDWGMFFKLYLDTQDYTLSLPTGGTGGQQPQTPQQPQQPVNTGGTPTLSVSTAAPLTEATLHEGIVTLTLSGGTYERASWRLREAVSVSGITGIALDTFDTERINDTKLTIKLEFDGNINTDSTLTLTLGAGAIADYNGAALTAQIPVTAVSELVTASTAAPLTEATLDESIVTLTLSGRKFERRNATIRSAMSVSGISGVTVRNSDIDRQSDTEVTVELTFNGNLNADGTLTLTVGADAIAGYNGPAFTVQVSVSASTDTPADTGNKAPDPPQTQQPGDTGGTPTLSVSTAAPLTEATLHGGIITLNLSSGTYEESSWRIRDAVSVSGIGGVTLDLFTSRDRVSDTEITIELEYDGNMTANGTLTVSVGAGAIQDYNGAALTAQLSIPAVTESVTASTAAPLTEATLDESVVTLTLSGRKFEGRSSIIRAAISVSGISGVTVRSFDIDRESDTEVTVELTFNGNLNADGTLTFTVGAGAIAGYNGPALTDQVSVSASTDAPADTGNQNPETPQQPDNTGGTPTLSTSTAAPLTEATLHEGIVTLTLSGGTYERSSWRLRDAVSVSGVTGIALDTFDTERISDTKLTIKLEFDGNINTDSTLTITVEAGAIVDYNGAALTAQIPVTAVSESISASTAAPLTEATLDESIVTLTLSGRKFERWNSTIRSAVSVTGISGVTVRSFDIDRESDTEVTVELTFNGDMTANGTLTFTVGADAIAGYNGPALTDQVSVSASTDAPADTGNQNPDPPETPQQPENQDTPQQPGNTGGTPTLTASTTSALTEVTLHGNVVTLTLSGGTYERSRWDIEDAVSVSGISGVTFDRFFGLDRVSDTKVTVELEFSGNMNTNGTLTFTVEADAIAGYNGAALTAQIAVSAVSESVSASPSTLTEGTLDGAEVSITLSGRKFERFVFDIQDAVSVSGIAGVTMPWHQPRRKSDTEITIELEFDGDMNTDGTLTFTVGSDAIAGYNGPALTAQVAVTADRENALFANFPNPFNPETWIPYQLEKPTEVTITIYAINGHIVRTLDLGHQPAGLYQNRSRAAYWDGRNAFGEPVASGVYFYTITAGDFSATRKMLIRK